MAEFEEKCDGDSEVRMNFVGVSKSGKKWRARVRHPKLRTDVYIGSYSSREEAAFAVAKKKAEFEDMLMGEDGMSVETCEDDFEGRKLPVGVYRRGYGRWCARIWHPKLKKRFSLGNYESVEEAAAAVKKKRAEFLEMYWWKPGRARFIPDCNGDNDEVLEKPERELTSTSEFLEKSETKLTSTSKSLDERTRYVKVPAGVTKVKSGRWVARIHDQIKRSKIWTGSSDTAEEAARCFNSKKAVLAAKRKRSELSECEFRHKERAVNEAVPEFGYELQTPDTEDIKSIVVGEKSKCGITDVPWKLEYNIDHSSLISAIEPEISSCADVSDKSILSQENCGETACACDFDEVRNHFVGVSKSGKKWRARVRHPKLKIDVYIGSYNSREEAAFAVAKKKAEFEKMLKSEGSMCSETCKDDFEGRKLPFGVYRRGYQRWCVRIWHPKLKKLVSSGNYKSVEEAAAAVNKKRAEFQDMYWWKPVRARFIPDCKDNDNEVVEKHENELLSASKRLDERTADAEVPAGVTKVKSGRWVARINDRIKRPRIWLGSYDIAEEAARSFNRKKAMHAAKRKSAEFSECEFRHKERAVSEALPEFGYERQTPDTEELESIAVGENSKCGVTDVPFELESDIVHSSPTSAIEPDISSSADVSDKIILSEENCRETACACDFDDAVNLGFIDEYGQLLGMYSELDEQMGLETV